MEHNPPSRQDQGDRELPWLVKASGRVLGPYTREELIAKLQSKEFVLLDEVALPTSRWKYIRDEPLFAKVVEELRRGAYAGREDTMTSTSTVGTRSLTDDIEHDPDGISMTEAIDPDQSLQDAESTQRIDQYSPRPFPKPDGPPARAQYRHDPLGTTPNRPSDPLRYVWPSVIVLALVALGGLAFVYHNQKLAHQKEASYDTLLQQGVDAKRMGDFPKALDFLKRAHQLRPDEAEINFILAPMLIALEGQTVVGKRMLQKVLLLKYRPSEVAQAKTAMGLASLMDSNLDEAKQYLTEALEAQKNFYPALANMGVVQYMRGDYQGSQDFLAQALNENHEDYSLYVLMNRSQIESIEKKQHTQDDLVEIAKTLKNVASDAFDYRQEAFLLATYANVLRSTDELDTQVEELLDMDPQLTNDHVHELLVYRQSISWSMLLPLCQRLQSSEAGARRKALMAFCYSKAGNQLESGRLIEMAVHKAPDDPLIKAHYSLMLKEQGKEAEARTAISGLPEYSQKYQLPYIAEGRICEAQNDLACAEMAYQKLLNMNPNAIQGLAGMGRILVQRGDLFKANQMFTRGFQLNPRYIPLIQLQWAINERTTKK